MKKIGVIGCGARMRGFVSRVAKASNGEIEIAAIHDISQRSIDDSLRVFPEAHICNNVEELVSREDIDWVFVGSFNASHRAHAVAALDAGKHVFCEKPLASTAEDCVEILRACTRNPGRHFAIGFNLRFSPFYQKMRRMLEDGCIGEIISLEFNETTSPNHGAAMHGNWRRHRSKSGPLLLEKCCHDMDLLHWLTSSRPRRVASFGGLNFFKPENAHCVELYPTDAQGCRYYELGLVRGHAVGKEDNICPFNADKDIVDNQVAIIELESGARASFHLCTHAALNERRFYICGTKGIIRGDVLTGKIDFREVGWDTPVQTFHPITGGSHGGGDSPLHHELAQCVLADAELSTTIYEAIASAFTCFGIDEAMRTGTVVDMNTYWDLLSL